LELKETLRFTQDCVVVFFNIVLRFVYADTAVMENQMEKPTPYTTKSGLQIGCNYTPPSRDYMSADAEFLQAALLGIEPQFSQRRVAGWVVYAICIVAMFFLVAAWVN
jgi:hypothetical protein